MTEPEMIIDASAEPAVKITGDVWAKVPEDLAYDDISDKAVRVYICLYRHGQTPDSCYPSHKVIAKLLRCQPRSVQRPIAELEERGWIDRFVRYNEQGARVSDGYFVHLQRRAPSAPYAQESAYPTRSDRDGVRAQERAKREPVKESQLKRNNRIAPSEPARADYEISEFDDEKTKRLKTEFKDTFWRAYPNRQAKPDAWRAYEVARRKAEAGRIMAGLAAWSEHWEARGQPEYIPYPQKWLRQERWNQNPPAASAKRNGSPTAEDGLAVVRKLRAYADGESVEDALPVRERIESTHDQVIEGRLL